jgi:hypothetical protein
VARELGQKDHGPPQLSRDTLDAHGRQKAIAALTHHGCTGAHAAGYGVALGETVKQRRALPPLQTKAIS